MKRDAIPTHTSPIRRAGAALWQALEDHPALPMSIVFGLLLLVNSPLFN